MSSFWSADWHLFHNGVAEYCNRPWKSMNQMTQHLAANHNEIVKPDDTFWNIGDVTMMSQDYAFKIKKHIDKFNGVKHLVLGNHDDWRPRTYQHIGFTTVHTAFWFEYKGYTFYMMHDPAEYTFVQNDPKAIVLCGHVHQVFKHLLPDKRLINVGVDVWDYRPVSFDQILELLCFHGIEIS